MRQRLGQFFGEMNPLVRGLLIVALISLMVVILQLNQTLLALGMILRIAFFLAIAFFVFLMWRERRSDIDLWPERAKWTFYAAALLIVADVATWFLGLDVSGFNAIAFLLVLAGGIYAMVRIWRDQHHYA